MPPTPSFSLRSINDEEGNKDEGVPPENKTDLELDPAGASYSFWNLNRWRNISGANNNGIEAAIELELVAVLVVVVVVIATVIDRSCYYHCRMIANQTC